MNNSDIKKTTPKQEKKLLEKAKTTKGKRRQLDIRQIINSNINLVKYMITRYFSYARLDYDELLSEGVRSLPKAIEKFNLESKNRFAVYAGCWIAQYIRSYIEKTKIIKSASGSEKEVIYYDDAIYQSSDKSSYSILDTISGNVPEDNQEKSRNYDINKYTNSLINMLEKKETILFARLFFKIIPRTCWDIYCLVKDEEELILIKELKIKIKEEEALTENLTMSTTKKKKLKDMLSDLSCDSKKKTSSIISKYFGYFQPSQYYKIKDISRIMNKSENYLRKIKQNCLEKLQEISKKEEVNDVLGIVE